MIFEVLIIFTEIIELKSSDSIRLYRNSYSALSLKQIYALSMQFY